MKAKRKHMAVETVPISELKHYPGNPRIHDVVKLAESISEHGQYKPLVVQLSTGFVLAGNGTLTAMRDYLGLTEAMVVWVDVDDEKAKRIVLMDNSASDTAAYETSSLVELFNSLPDFVGTGWSENEVQQILDAARPKVDDLPGEDASWLEGEGDAPIQEVEEEEPVVVRFKALDPPEMPFPGDGWWEMPALLPDMIPEVDPSWTWEVWTGPEDARVQNLNPDRWLFVEGRDSPRGLPWERTAINFWTWDERFDRWWLDPQAQMTRLLNAGCWALVEPDFGVYYELMARPERLWNVYRNRWVGRYAQYCGIKVIPQVSFCLPGDDEAHMSGIPKGANIVAAQLQTFDQKRDDRVVARWLKTIVQRLEPKVLMLYGGPNVKGIPHLGVPVIRLLNRAHAQRRAWRWKYGQEGPEPSGPDDPEEK